jgi:hypothetical protein
MAARNATRLADRFSPIPQNTGNGIFPADGERFINLQILTRLYTPPAQDALIRVVTVEGIGFVDFVRLVPKRNALMFNFQQGSRIMNGAIPIVVIAHGTIQKMVF